MKKSKNYRISTFLVMGLVSLVSTASWATDYPHNFEKAIQCVSCHRIHGAMGRRLTEVGGIVNLCKLCHQTGGSASQFNLEYGDEALPGSSGTSHGFETPADQPGYDATIPTDADMSQRLENGNIVCTVCHEPHNHQRGFPFLRNTRDTICENCHTNRVQSAPPYTSHPVDVTLPVTGDYQTPAHLELFNGLVKCLTCHGIHYTYSATQIRGTAESGTTTCLTDVDQNWTTDALVGWELKVLVTSNPNMHNWYQRRLITSNTTDTVCWSDPLPDPIVAGDPYVLKERGPGDGFLLTQSAQELCSQCHTYPASASHFASASSLWPGGQYGSNYAYTSPTGEELWPPGRSGGVYNQPLPTQWTGTCFNCHWPHGWSDGTGGTYPRLLVDREEKLCYTCHDGAPAATDVVPHFEATLWVSAGAGNWNNTNLNTRHDVNDADQNQSGAKIECVNCHDPHRASGTNPPQSRLIADPDPTDGRVPTPGNTWPNSDFQSEWCLDCHDGSFPPEVTPPTNALMNILDTWTSGGQYKQDKHARIRTGPFGENRWDGDTPLSCTTCHDPSHRSRNLFQLREVVYYSDGVTPIPSQCGTGYEVTNNNTNDTTVNGWCWCNTCHMNSMGNKKTNCFTSGCHHHGSGKF